MGSERKEMRTLKFLVETTQSEELVYLNQDKMGDTGCSRFGEDKEFSLEYLPHSRCSL